MSFGTDIHTLHQTPPEAIFPREGFVMVNGEPCPVFLVHADTRCDVCEFEHGNARCHPPHEAFPDLVVGCDNILIKLVR